MSRVPTASADAKERLRIRLREGAGSEASLSMALLQAIRSLPMKMPAGTDAGVR